jgi:hypothetical protein
MALTTLLACGGAPTGEVAARVDGISIPVASVKHWMAAFSRTRTLPPPGKAYDALKHEGLAHLITARWLISEAAAQGPPITRQQVARRLEDKQREEFPGGAPEARAYLRTAGRTRADVELEVETELAASRLRQVVMTRAPHITHLQVAAYYRLHRRDFLLPEQREVQLTDRKTIPEVKHLIAEVHSGRPFASIAQVGHFTRIAHMRSGVAGLLEKAIFTARPRRLTGIVKHYLYYFIFKVQHITPARHLPLPSAEAAILSRLRDKASRRALADFSTTWAERWTARTDCSTGNIVSLCKQYHGRRARENPFAAIVAGRRHGPFE